MSYYAFDNEPMLWNSTHRDVHPQPTTYDEVRDRTFQFGAAIKAVDPSAKTLGPVEWGWCGYFYSAADGCSAGTDYQAHGSTPFVAWYLQQMRNYEQQYGVRILDYFDLHIYPQANGVALSSAGGAATQAVRLRSTRSLWDPTYIDESWISDTVSGGVPVQMIPRMKKWVGDNYPGTKLAISEYNWGANESMNGALAQADVLGIFGREGLDIATYWGSMVSSDPLAFAFRMYRNYDGLGHGFGDIAIQSSSADQGTMAVYSAQRSNDGALTIMVINKSANDLTSLVGFTGFDPLPNAAVYRYSQANLAAIEHLSDQVVTATGLHATFPANSITMVVVAAGLQTKTPVQPGWNLLGNSGSESLAVSALFGDATSVNSVWKWDAVRKLWQFYTPALQGAALSSYASKQGYDILSDIKPGDGYWVNAKTACSALFQLGAPFKLTATNLATGWGLFANGTSLNPSAFNVGLSAVSPVPGTIPQNFISLWAWDNASSMWYFFAPSLQAQGENVLADYVNAKGYLDFTSNNKSIEPGVGFWVFK